ncbi:hypothetical protein [Streptomyces sp. NPDC059398]|uniref:hypothetical protein n=1 Tax=Streptomyces sp. NPDC059398 TaxID=3346820 RepID=UPI0036B1A734
MLERQPEGRPKRQWYGVVCALVLVVPVSGCGTSTVALPAARKPPCAADGGALVGRLDGDPYPDRVTTGDHGRETVVEWGTPGGGFGRPVGIHSLAGAHHGEVAAGVAADITGDDQLDLAVVVSRRPEMDDPSPARIGEVRVDPLHRNGRSGHTIGLGVDENEGLSVTDLNHDGRPDVAVWEYHGDGMFGVTPLLGAGSGLSGSGAVNRWRTGDAGIADPVRLPQARLTQFYRRCGADGDGRG